jgi:heat shock protein HtpX
MTSVRGWLIPRVAFWIGWTVWLECLQFFLLDRWKALPADLTLLFVVGVPLLVIAIGSWLAKDPVDSAMPLFLRGAAVSCLLGVFTNIFLMKEFSSGIAVLALGFPLFGYLSFTLSRAARRIDVKQGDLFERVQAIARRTGVSVGRVIVFTTRRNSPAAFAQRTGAILLSDQLLRILSRREVDAVIAHEAAHLRRKQTLLIAALPMTAAIAVPAATLWPAITTTASLWPILALLLWRALRRFQEFDADATALETTRDPEALITAFVRVSNAAGIPLHWGRSAGILMTHPPMTARLHAIARKAGLDASKVDELVAMASTVPALPGYASPLEEQPEACAVLAAHRDRLRRSLRALSTIFPVAAGIAFAALSRFWAAGLMDWLTLIVPATVTAMLLYWIAYETIVGSERRRFRAKLTGANQSAGYFVGFAPAAEPQEFDGLYHFDLGIARIEAGALTFAGARCFFTLPRASIRRTWIAAGPPHWTPRKIVCVEYQSGDSQTAVLSLQSLERWFWPATSAAAQQLLSALEQWLQTEPHAQTQTTLPPQAIGSTLAPVPLAGAFRTMRVPCTISLAVSWFGISFLPPTAGDYQAILSTLASPFAAPLMTAILILFALTPHLNWSSSRSRPSMLNRVPTE